MPFSVMFIRNKSGERYWFPTELGYLSFEKLQQICFGSPINPSFTSTVPIKPRRPTTREEGKKTINHISYTRTKRRMLIKM